MGSYVGNRKAHYYFMAPGIALIRPGQRTVLASIELVWCSQRLRNAVLFILLTRRSSKSYPRNVSLTHSLKQARINVSLIQRAYRNQAINETVTPGFSPLTVRVDVHREAVEADTLLLDNH